MATSYRAETLMVLKNNEQAMTAMFRGASDNIRGILLRYATNDQVSLQSLDEVQNQVSSIIRGLFVGRRAGGDLVPFEVVNGQVQPISPYARILFSGIQASTRSAVMRHRSDMLRKLARRPDLLARMRAATANPLAVSRQVSEQVVFNPNPLAHYEPAHRWVDPSGYRLSDRIWRTSISTRRYVDQLVEIGIRRGRSAMAIAQDLERALWPGRRPIRTTAPYNIDASFDAMRLARTEITRANAQADNAAANLNPFVGSYEVVLSGSHPRADVCDDEASGGPYSKDDTSHLPPFHPHCICYSRWLPSENAGAVIATLSVEAGKQRSLLLDTVGPLLVDRLTDMLLGNISMSGPGQSLAQSLAASYGAEWI